MSNTILLKRSGVASAVPSTANIALGELAINTYDGKLYTKIDNGTAQIVELTQNQTITLSGNVSGSGTNNIAVSLNATQTNITTVGTLTALSVTGNISGSSNISATGNVSGGNLITVGNAVVGGIKTDNYYYANGTPVDFQQAAGSNTQIQYNLNGDFGASANFTFNSATNVLTVTGNTDTTTLNATTVNATGNVTGGNVVATNAFIGNIQVSGNISVESILANTTITANGNVTGGNLVTAGQVSATGNVTGGNINTAGLVSATGNVSGGNITTAGRVDASGNITGANVNANVVSATTVVATANVSAGNVNTNTVSTASGSITITTGDTNGNINLLPTGSGNIVLNDAYINNVKNPVQAQDAATKEYVDNAVSTGITIHTPVRLEANSAISGTYAQGGTTATVTDTVAGNTVVFSSAINPQVNDQLWFSNSFQGIQANTAYFVVSAPNTSAAVLSLTYSGAPVTNITSATGLTQAVRINSGQGATLTNNGANATLVVDGVTVNNGDRILVYSQANAVHNGVYVVSEAGNATTAWQLTRSSDMNTYVPDDINGADAGDYFYVQAGNSGAGESYVMTAPVGPFIIGYDPLVFTQFSASQVYSANTDAGLSLSGTVFSAKVDNDTTAFDVGGNIVVKPSANLTTPNIGAATGSSLVLTANVAANNVSATNIVTANVVNANTATFNGNVSSGNISTGQLTATGNASVLGIKTDNYYYANGTPVDFQQAAGSNTQVQYNLNGDFGASANFTYNSATGVLTVTGNISSGNLNTTTVSATTVGATGNVSGGNLTTAGTANIATLEVTTLANIKATTAATSTVTGALKVAGGVGVAGNIYGGTVYSDGNLVLNVASTIDGGSY